MLSGRIRLCFFIFLSFASCSYPVFCKEKPHGCKNADVLITNGTFLTLNPKQPYAEAIAVTKGKIIAIGDKKTLKSNCEGPDTNILDLAGAAAVPGFINNYSHLILYGWLANHAIDLSTTNPFQREDWQPVKTIDAFLNLIKAKVNTEAPWLIIYGYDAARIKGNMLTQADLDTVSKTKPMIVFYASGKRIQLNQAAILQLKQDAQFANIQVDYDGVISGKSTDLFLQKIISLTDIPKAIEKATELFAKNGFTTAAEVQSISAWKKTYLNTLRVHSMPIDIIFPNEIINKQRKDKDSTFLLLDGLVQNFSAFLTEPYITTPSAFRQKWYGTLSETKHPLLKKINQILKNKTPLAVNVHGDAAMDFLLNALKLKAAKDIFLFNLQYIRPEQLKELHALHAKISWSAPYLYFWGESICQTRLGPERAFKMNPYKTTSDLFGSLSAHINTPESPPSAINSINWMTTRIVQRWNYPANRVCPQYFDIDERVPMLTALKAFTIDAAKFYGLDKEKGSLEIGKDADLTILNVDPLNTKGLKIQVIGTIFKGRLQTPSAIKSESSDCQIVPIGSK